MPYTIGAKRVFGYNGNTVEERLPVEKQYYAYIGCDDYAGSFSTGYPCLQNEIYCTKFASPEQAKQFLKENWKYFERYADEYDFNTLAVFKTEFTKTEKVNIDELIDDGDGNFITVDTRLLADRFKIALEQHNIFFSTDYNRYNDVETPTFYFSSDDEYKIAKTILETLVKLLEV